uniref:Protein TsetseEP domain-containing protein n=1 Tax=Anopheles melas TaxID=34690 RepID=A0A182U2X0_9DIPT
MNAFPRRVLLVLVLVCTGGCLTAPLPDPLGYLPTLEYLRNVLRVSVHSLSEVTLETQLPLTYNVSEALHSVRGSLNVAHNATKTITELFQANDTFQMQQLAEALDEIQQSLCDSEFRFPEYFKKESATPDMKQLKHTMSEHLKKVQFEKDTLEFDDLRAINNFLSGATSQAMVATVAVHIVSSVEKLEYYLRAIFFPPDMEATALKELQAIGQLVRSYYQLYGAALRTASTRFQDEASQGRQLFRAMLGTGAPEHLPESVKNAPEEFYDQVDNFIRTTLEDLQSTTRKGNDRFGEIVQNILYTSYGLHSSGMEMLRPYVRHYECVLNLVPRTQTVAGASLGSVALCSNEATATLYDSTMVYRQKIGHLQREIFEGLQTAIACTDGDCSLVYNETVDLMNASTDAVKAFTVDLAPYREQLLSCLSSKYEVEMVQVLDMSANFDKCVKMSY